MAIDVLFIDDDQQYVADISAYISELMSVRTAWTTDPSEVRRIVRDEGVKVVVLDQMMPVIDGVTLGEQIRQIDTGVRRVLLSGEATTAQVTSAYDRGFDRSIHKNAAIEQLPDAIRHSQMEWHIEANRRVRASPMVVQQVFRPGWRNRTLEKQIFLLSIDSVEEDYIPPGSWTQQIHINAGEEIEESVDVEWSLSDSLQVSSGHSSGYDLGLGEGAFGQLTAAVKAEVTRSSSLASTSSVSQKKSVKRRIALPPEPASSTERYVRSRTVQVAPTYRRFHVTLLTRCYCCGSDQQSKADLLVNSGRTASRQLDVLSDGTEQIVGPGVFAP